MRRGEWDLKKRKSSRWIIEAGWRVGWTVGKLGGGAGGRDGGGGSGWRGLRCEVVGGGTDKTYTQDEQTILNKQTDK